MSDTAPGFVRYPNSPFELYQPYPPAGDQPGAIRAVNYFRLALSRKHFLQSPGQIFTENGNDARFERLDLFPKQRKIGARRHTAHGKAIRKSAYHFEGVDPDGSG